MGSDIGMEEYREDQLGAKALFQAIRWIWRGSHFPAKVMNL
jgi:hypothetical protein